MCGQPGIDIVPVARIDSLIRTRGDGFLTKWFTPAEIAYCTAKAVPSRHFAARFAAKEAVAKVLPSSWDHSLPWRSIEIVNTETGAPVVRLHGPALALARQAGVGTVRISLSHCDQYATAMAVTEHAAQPGLGRVHCETP